MTREGAQAAAATVVSVEDLYVRINTPEGTVYPLAGVDLTITRGQTLGLVGESGCGKSMTARAIMQMLPKPAIMPRGRVIFYRHGDGSVDSVELSALHPTGRSIRRIRGKEIAMVFQEPMTSFSLVHTIGNQIEEVITLHQRVGRREARRRAAEMLRVVGIPDPFARLGAYPFELSGGMRQRAMIAMALSCNPSLLIADEPTTALDVTIQAQILELLQELQQRLGMCVLLITHNLGVVAQVAHRVAVMYLGRIVEEATTEDLFAHPKHPYSQGLLRSIPQFETRTKRLWAMSGMVPEPFDPPSGCPFHPRCPDVMPGLCDEVVPELARLADGHRVSCHLYSEGRDEAT